MDKNIKKRNCNYRIIKYDEIYLVDKKYGSSWIREHDWQDEGDFSYKIIKTFKSIEDAEKYINDDKLENDTKVQLIKYL